MRRRASVGMITGQSPAPRPVATPVTMGNMKANGRVPTEGGAPLAQNPFAGLSSAGLPASATGHAAEAAAGPNQPPPGRNRGRVDITRQTAGRGGKTVTVVSGFVGIGQRKRSSSRKKCKERAAPAAR